jgi:hypothetical protein
MVSKLDFDPNPWRWSVTVRLLSKKMGIVEQKKISPKEYFENMTPCPIPNT